MKIHLVNSFCWFGFMIKDNKICKQQKKQKCEKERKRKHKKLNKKNLSYWSDEFYVHLSRSITICASMKIWRCCKNAVKIAQNLWCMRKMGKFSNEENGKTLIGSSQCSCKWIVISAELITDTKGQMQTYIQK